MTSIVVANKVIKYRVPNVFLANKGDFKKCEDKLMREENPENVFNYVSLFLPRLLESKQAGGNAIINSPKN
ncbi:hypothetical protein [Solimicrobium silvestre]|uniref:Uncharacterized protein n=1 Tax=Solimicrobium silvestre TaxID=2099400 RepID=A0A2S9H1K6_9BURK|nr:hypothetical protein [Solimicrobium silvestre]PRC93848.1 hypothetical protein S2091_1457 [Solimicrobium silvestre]